MVISAAALFSITAIVCFEVASRYFFDSPTTWAWDINVQLTMLMVMFGLSEVYRRDLNVRVDVLSTMLPQRVQIFFDILFALLLIFITGVLVWIGWSYFEQSYSRGQTASTTFAPLLWPVKLTLPVGAAVLMAQGILKMIRDISRLFSPIAMDEHASMSERRGE